MVGLALLGNAGKVALNVGAEHGPALVREALSEALQSHGLAGSGGAGDETVAVGEAEIDEFGLDALADIDAVLRRRARRIVLRRILFRRCLPLSHRRFLL